MLIALLTLAAAADLRAAGDPGLRAIRGNALSAHIRFLSDDLLEGRGTGTRGHGIAARYVATQLQAIGLEPAGERGSWLQAVPLIGMTVEPSGCALELDGVPLRYGDDVLFTPRAGAARDDVQGELVFAGYGVSAPEYGYEDVPADLRGKIAVILYGAPRSERPDFFPTAASAVYSDGVAKARRLQARGASAAVLVFTPELSQHLPWPFFVRTAPFEKMAWREGDKPGSGSVLPVAVVPPERLAPLLANSGRSAEQVFADARAGKLKPFPLGVRARVAVQAKLRDLVSENVVGVLRGGERAGEHVVVTAHLDHLGIGPKVNGDAIYNGALDDAAGLGAIIEMGRAFAALPRRPARSILFLAVTAEEKGLQGSDYFAHHPTVPAASIVANVNVDGPFGQWEPHDLVVLGGEHSSLGAAARAAADALSLKVSADPQPEQVFFIRSDQYSFVRQGVPSIFPTVGWLDAQGATEANRARQESWTKTRYHQPSDEWDPSLDYEHMAQEVRADFLIALAIARDPERPRWNTGDVFEKLFGNKGVRASGPQ